MPLKLALGVRETPAGHRLGAWRGGAEVTCPQGCFRREGTSEAVPEAVRQAVGGCTYPIATTEVAPGEALKGGVAPPPPFHAVASRSDSAFRFLAPMCIVFPSHSFVKSCAF